MISALKLKPMQPLLVPQAQYEDHCKHTVFEEYLFNAHDGSRLLALGDGSLFNHSRRPNISYRLDLPNRNITYSTSHKAVAADEELCIFYGPDEKLWFDMPPDNDAASEEEDDTEGDSWLRAVGGGSLDDEPPLDRGRAR